MSELAMLDLIDIHARYRRDRDAAFWGAISLVLAASSMLPRSLKPLRAEDPAGEWADDGGYVPIDRAPSVRIPCRQARRLAERMARKGRYV